MTSQTLSTCCRCLKQTDGIHTCTPSAGWLKLEEQHNELLAALERCRFALEPYDDIKPRDWKSDRLNLRDAHQAAVAAIARVKGGAV